MNGEFVHGLAIALTDAAAELVPQVHSHYWDVADYLQQTLVEKLRPVAEQHRATERACERAVRRAVRRAAAKPTERRTKKGGKR